MRSRSPRTRGMSRGQPRSSAIRTARSSATQFMRRPYRKSWRPQLVGGAVPDPHRPRAAIALEVVEGLLHEVRGAVDPVHDLERGLAGAVVLLDPGDQPA